MAHLRFHTRSGERFDWPVSLSVTTAHGDALVVRSVTSKDVHNWMDVRSQNWKWLEPWESGDPTGEGAQSYSRWIRSIDVAAARGTSAIFIIEYGGRLVGEVSVGAISYGSIRSAIAGYWVSEEFAGRSFVPTALARVCDWAFSDPRGPRLHRVEVALLPNNDNSKRVVQKLCFSYEGIRKQYMFVHGAWRDHETWSLLSSSVQGSVVDRI